MDDRFCPSCGTEVEAGARFCPTCGTTLAVDDDSGLPPAPAWPPPETEPTVAANEPTETGLPVEQSPDAEPEPDPVREPEPVSEPEPQPEAPPPAAAAASAPPPAGTPPAPPTSPGPELPFTWPTMLSGWLIGSGALLGAIFLIPRLGNVLSLLLFLALLGIAASIFLADRVPDVPRLRLIILVTSMIGLGVGLARAGFSVQGADTLFLVAMLAAAGGALLIELDRDRPMPPPERPPG